MPVLRLILKHLPLHQLQLRWIHCYIWPLQVRHGVQPDERLLLPEHQTLQTMRAWQVSSGLRLPEGGDGRPIGEMDMQRGRVRGSA